MQIPCKVPLQKKVGEEDSFADKVFCIFQQYSVE